MADGKMVKYVHSVRETNDSTLWVVSAGEGIVKIILDATSLLPKVKSARRFTLDGGKRNSIISLSLFRRMIRLFGLVTVDMVRIK